MTGKAIDAPALLRQLAGDLARGLWSAPVKDYVGGLHTAADQVERDRGATAEMLAVAEKLARLKTGPTQASRADWIGNVLELAEEARAAIAKVRPRT